jgi:hypothetical protein
LFKRIEEKQEKVSQHTGEPYCQPENSPVYNFIKTLSNIFKHLHADALADETDAEKLKSKFL